MEADMSYTDLLQADTAEADPSAADTEPASLAEMHPVDMPRSDAEPSGEGDLVVDTVSKHFRTGRTDVHALDTVSLHVRPGEFVCLAGPGGCGKPPLLDIIGGLAGPDHGGVRGDGIGAGGPHGRRLVMFQ